MVDDDFDEPFGQPHNRRSCIACDDLCPDSGPTRPRAGEPYAVATKYWAWAIARSRCSVSRSACSPASRWFLRLAAIARQRAFQGGNGCAPALPGASVAATVAVVACGSAAAGLRLPAARKSPRSSVAKNTVGQSGAVPVSLTTIDADQVRRVLRRPVAMSARSPIVGRTALWPANEDAHRYAGIRSDRGHHIAMNA